MRRLRDGDDLALNEIMDRWQRRLTSYLLRAIGNETVAVDLAQETFVRVYQSREKYQPRGEFSTWLFAIATNLLRQHFRWLKRHPTVSMDSVEPGRDDPPLSERLPAEDANTVERDERSRIVKDAVTALPPDMREAVLLFEYEDLSHEQIAKVAGCSKKAVETRLYRARALLREKLRHWLAS
ncbi:MAG: sigma-70 family RNA polymerase sigma factor [Verrucomicrobia bacterium]|nr:sigma-70 family RNA polymerase sigma factor [Verrucomicrobiota bacterium]